MTVTAPETKTCRDCARALPLATFGAQTTYCKPCHAHRSTAWRNANKDKVNARNRDYYHRNRDRRLGSHRNWLLRTKYGITVDEYWAMRSDQQNCCAACGVDAGDSWLEVDHCHANGHVRGLLCKGCNCAAGQAKDDPVRLRQIADYLERAAR